FGMKIPVAPLLVQDGGFMQLHGDFEADLTPHGLDQLSSMLEVRVRVARHHDDLSTNRLGLAKQRLCLVRIEFWPGFGPSRKPRTGRRIEPFGDLTTTIKYCLLNRLMVDGVGCGQTQLLVCERAFFHIEYEERCGQRWDLPGLKFT